MIDKKNQIRCDNCKKLLIEEVSTFVGKINCPRCKTEKKVKFYSASDFRTIIKDLKYGES